MTGLCSGENAAMCAVEASAAKTMLAKCNLIPTVCLFDFNIIYEIIKSANIPMSDG